VPLEETVGAMLNGEPTGKSQHMGLCEVTADELTRRDAVHPIAAVQVTWL